MWLTANRFAAVFWVVVLPAFVSFWLIVFAAREPATRAAAPSVDRSPGLAEYASVGSACWYVIAIGSVFTLARFSEAFPLEVRSSREAWRCQPCHDLVSL
jgi:hypothetical protein